MQSTCDDDDDEDYEDDTKIDTTIKRTQQPSMPDENVMDEWAWCLAAVSMLTQSWQVMTLGMESGDYGTIALSMVESSTKTALCTLFSSQVERLYKRTQCMTSFE